MKALRYLGSRKLEVQELPVPEPAKGEVLIKVMACGICGSDVHGYLGLTGRRIQPMTMGHEFCGEVAKLGTSTNKFKVGDKVIVQPIHFCSECVNCKRGLTMLCLNKRFLVSSLLMVPWLNMYLCLKNYYTGFQKIQLPT